MIRFVIWGAAFRGKNICAYLGSERIIAFIDKSLELQGQIIEGIPVISYEEYKNTYRDIPVIISPILHRDEIKEILEKDNIMYFNGYSLPPQITENPNKSKILKFQNFVLEEIKNLDAVPLWGANLYSIILYELFRKKGIETYIVDESLPDELRKKIIQWGISVSSLRKQDIVCLTEAENDISYNGSNTCLNLYDLKKYYANPKIERFKNIHQGERCFIVATGPSLKLEDLETLRANNEICMSMNGIIKLYDKSAWRPNYYMIEDNFGFNEWKEELLKHTGEVITFVADWCNTDEVADGEIISYHLSKQMNNQDNIPEFSEDFSVECFWSSTISYECLQLAYYMGFKEIIFLGLDFNYGLQYNHFNKDYHSSEDKGQIDHSKQLRQMRKGFVVASKFAKEHGIKIINASRQTQLDVYEKMDFEKLFN